MNIQTIVTESKHSHEAREALLRGITFLNDAVKVTLGPGGRNVLFRSGWTPISTKDGVTVAREIRPADPFEALGADVAQAVAATTVDSAGDGTTTATLLTQALFEAGVRAIRDGVSPVELAKGIRTATKAVVGSYDAEEKRFVGGFLSELAIPATPELIFNVAKISANGDEAIAKVVAEAVQKVGPDGAITIGTSPSQHHVLDWVEGLKIESGFLDARFVNDPMKNRVVLENCLVFLSDRRLSTQAQCGKIAEIAIKRAEQLGVPFSLLIIANDIDPEAIGYLVGNKLNNNVRFAAIQSPAWGPARKDLLEDIALITGGERIDSDRGKNYDMLPRAAFGLAARVVIGQQNTVITGFPRDAADKKKLFDPYVARIRALIEDTTLRPDEIDRAKQRLAQLTTGIAMIKVGGNSGGEVKERGFRVEDSIHATRAAVADGVVPGGGSALLFSSARLDQGNPEGHITSGESKGWRILAETLWKPLTQIAENAGFDGKTLAKQCYEALLPTFLYDASFIDETAVNSAAMSPGSIIPVSGSEISDIVATPPNRFFGFNATTGEVEDNMFEAGIVDPLKVVRTALNSAGNSVAQLLLTEVVLINKVIS